MEFARGEGHSEARLAKILQQQEEYCLAIEDAYRSGYASGYSDGYDEYNCNENDRDDAFAEHNFYLGYESGYAAGLEDGALIACGEDPDDEYIGLTD